MARLGAREKETPLTKVFENRAALVTGAASGIGRAGAVLRPRGCEGVGDNRY